MSKDTISGIRTRAIEMLNAFEMELRWEIDIKTTVGSLFITWPTLLSQFPRGPYYPSKRFLFQITYLKPSKFVAIKTGFSWSSG